jgi:23S rRNA (adenine2030-N6)-methyltransferase
MNYRHRFHAGNFADVVKHITLLEILTALARKPTPYRYFESHAGRGMYDLGSEELRENSEFGRGFGRLWKQERLPGALHDYVSLVRRLGAAEDAPEQLKRYPGSPLLAAALMRPEDRGLLFELNIAEADALRNTLSDDQRFRVECGDGHGGLIAHVPPKERRGLVLIDPAYERQDQEFPEVVNLLTEAYQRWATGIYAIWYPIKQRVAINRLDALVKQTGIRKILCAELNIFPDDSRVGLNGCGMLIVNPPYQLDQQLTAALWSLHPLLDPHPAATARCFWLARE